MAFESLSDKLQIAFKKLTGRGKLNEPNIKEAMREVRMALLEADVNYLVVKDFIRTVTERAVGTEILSSLNAGQQVIKIVSEELAVLMGGSNARLTWSSSMPTVYLLCGLQGAGKTTMAGKLAGFLKKSGKKPLLAACDIYRPAAIKQLQVVGEKAGVPVFEKGTQNPVITSREAVDYARYYGNDVLIIDTAGRLHIDEALMDELAQIKTAVHPQEILLTVDAMTGQDAVNVAKSFNEQLGIDGVILTKLDSDTRGGAALSVRAVTGRPIKFAGTGEKLTDIEPFHPDRMASRILGMGDVMTLIEKATEAMDLREQEKAAARNKAPADLSLDDFLDQMQQLKKMGPLQNVLGMIPGVGGKLKNAEIDENAMKKPEAIIRSMTPRERRNPDVLNASRRKRIAAGAGVTVQDVNQLMRQFDQMRKMMKQMMGNKRSFTRGIRNIPGIM
ncbi:MAG: signal recognition particle protein [Eubacteriales bacterium]|jgi:signal recognition particle subunit SRP54|nr:signal recognition particle protein [Eubacteriales bacterium]MDD3572740.1 signal recognition particle protein [Eubacteriales bacterium]MDD4134911.1 signal recognition particle protein [Eubacteriales bacterium]NLO13918.1 signal recognition particle protein [Clostridiales bacterium]